MMMRHRRRRETQTLRIFVEDRSMFQLLHFRNEGIMEFEGLKNNVILDLEKKEDYLKRT